MKSCRCLLFDLDHTLWDYDANSRDTLRDMFQHHCLADTAISDFESFHHAFVTVNDRLWRLYDFGKIGSEVIRKDRFALVLKSFDVANQELAEALSDHYIRECPKKSKLMPAVHETLSYLTERYALTVVTNGFEETQQTKLRCSGLVPFFDHVVTSQRAGFKKPAREIFDLALRLNRASSGEAAMVGDNLATDISGARNVSIRTVYFNPGKITHGENVDIEIEHMLELQKFF